VVDFKAKHAAANVPSGEEAAARIGQSGEIVDLSLLWQLTLEGRAFYGGHGIEETATSTFNGTLDEQKPMFTLYAPTGGTIVVPLSAQIRIHVEGGAAPSLYLGYVQLPRFATATATGMGPSVLNTLGGNPRPHQAILQHTSTAITAITDSQNILLGRRANILDNLISAEMLATDQRTEAPGNPVLEYEWEPFGPIMLYKGSGLAFWTATNNATATTYSVTWKWVELPSEIYLPS